MANTGLLVADLIEAIQDRLIEVFRDIHLGCRTEDSYEEVIQHNMNILTYSYPASKIGLSKDNQKEGVLNLFIYPEFNESNQEENNYLINMALSLKCSTDQEGLKLLWLAAEAIRNGLRETPILAKQFRLNETIKIGNGTEGTLRVETSWNAPQMIDYYRD